MKKKLLMVLSIGVMLNYSCQKDKLTPISQTQIPTTNNLPFSTPVRVQQQVLGIYQALRNGNMLGSRFQVYGDIKADNWVNLSTNAVTGLQTWNETVTSTNQEVIGLWAQAYTVINDCNLFLDGMAAGGTAVVNNSTLSTNYISEAKFIRALSYWCLLQYYARPYYDGNGSKPGVPLRLNGNLSYGNYDLAKSTTDQVYQQIIKDLNDAETGLPGTYGNDVSNTTRAHKNTAIALKTRIYLSMQRYADVITEANKIVSAAAPFTVPNSTTVPNALQADVTKVFIPPYTTTESILSMPFNSTETATTQNQLGYYFYNNASAGNAEYYLNPTGIIANTGWKSTDKRRSFIYASTVKANVGLFFLSKFPLNPYTDWSPVMRYPEVLLNLAEAITMNGKIVDTRAVALLNAVRNRSDATTAYTAASFATYTNVENAILLERNIEFLGEGLRFPDLARLGLPIPAKLNIPAIAATDTRYIWPISNNELLYNPLIGGSNN
ncbi:MAG: RagB/SusD family nutrient uptake outer membrane protein [Janthinobacterium lividum]